MSVYEHKKTSIRQNPRKVIFSATKEKLTTNAGLIPIFKLLEKLDFRKLVQKCVNHIRGASSRYQLEDVIEIISTGLISGGFSMSGIESIWLDPVLRELGGFDRVPVDTTMKRILSELDFGELDLLQRCNHLLRDRFWNSQIHLSKEFYKNNVYFDCDSTVITTCGHQEGAMKGYNPEKQGAKSYHPLLIFHSITKELIQGWFRSGDAYTSNNCVDFLKQLFCYIQIGLKIIFRADSGFFDGKILDCLDEKGHGYLVKAKHLESIIAKQTKWEKVKGHRDFEQTEFYHKCYGWSKERRFVALRTLRVKDKKVRLSKKALKKLLQPELFQFEEYDYFCYVLTENLSPWEAHKSYRQRATSETWIEEFKGQIGGGKVRTQSFNCNDALFQCMILAYNIMRWMAIKTENKLLQQWEIKTLRTFIIRTAGKLVFSGNQFYLRFPHSILHKNMFLLWVDTG